MDIGKAVVELRKEFNLPQKVLALKSGLTSTSLCNIEKGKFSPTNETLEKIGNALGVPVDYIILLSLTDKDIPEDKRKTFRYFQNEMKELLLAK